MGEEQATPPEPLRMTARGLAPGVGLAHGRETGLGRARGDALKMKVLRVLYCMGHHRENYEVRVGAACLK